MDSAPPPDPRSYRKRMRRQESAAIARFITFSCYNRLPLLNNRGIMDYFTTLLSDARHRHGLKLHAWVIMPEHVHLIIRAAGSPWSAVAQHIKTGLSRRVLGRWRELGPVAAGILNSIKVGNRHRFWQHGGGFDRNLRSTRAMVREICYIHHNPVKRGLIAKPEQWKWSSVRWWMGQREGEVECDLPLDPDLDPKHWRGFV